MGYITHFDGEFRIEPPLTWSEIRESRFAPERAERERLDVKVRIEETEVDTNEGVMTRRAGVALVPTYEEEMRGYDIVSHVQLFLDTYGDRHRLTDRLDCAGEETGDLWRLEIHDGRAVKVQPRIVWPDGSESVPR
jgi:hypothetical protein